MNETLLERMRDVLLDKRIPFEEKKMFGGIAFMIRGNMSVGITNKGEFMVRMNPAEQGTAMKKKGVRAMDFTGKPMRGFLFVSTEGYERDKDLVMWIEVALNYNASLPDKTLIADVKKEKAKNPGNSKKKTKMVMKSDNKLPVKTIKN